jgi:hypothetical protein
VDIKAILDAVPPPTTAGRKRNISTKEKAIRGAKRIEKQAKEKLAVITKRETAAKSAPKKQIKNVKDVVKAIEGTAPSVVEINSLVAAPPTVQKYAEENVIFSPNPGPQTDFLAASEREVFYGGARGGGKSYSLLVDPLRYCSNGNHSGLILRRTMPELRDLIMHSNRLYPKAYPGAKWREQEKEWRFPSGAKIEFGYAENRQDALRYQGRAYNWIGIDELPQFPDEGILNDLRGSLRSVDLSLPEFIRATGNPGNVGSAWVKELFINPAPANTRFAAAVDTPKGKREITRRYIPAKLADNPYLTQSDSYLIMLSSLPEIQRRQWLDGDWDIWDGAAFPEFRKDVHVVQPFPIPKSWVKFRAADWGYSSPACVLWFAIDWDNNLYVYRELYVKQMTADKFAQRIRELEKDDGNIQFGVLDSSVWSKRGDVGPSIVETMMHEGVRWRPSDRSSNSRHAGKQEVHRRLALIPELDKPTIFFFPNCKNIIRDLPTLPLDDNDPEDVDTKANDHSYDALRYGVMSRAVNPRQSGWINRMVESEQYQPSDDQFGY